LLLELDPVFLLLWREPLCCIAVIRGSHGWPTSPMATTA
jgi:hypothetical protein